MTVTGKPLRVFASHTRAARLKIGAAHSKSYTVRAPDGVETKITNLSAFCREHGLTSQAMVQVANGNKRHHKKWECRRSGQSRRAWLRSAESAPKRQPKMFDRAGRKRCSGCKKYFSTMMFSFDKNTAYCLAAYCRHCEQENSKEDYEKHKDIRQANSAAYRKANRESIRARAAAYNRRNKQKITAKMAAARKVNPAHYKLIAKRYRKKNASVILDRCHVRRAKIRNNGPVENISRRTVWERDNESCWLCKKPVAFTDMHLDHVVPVSQGGTHTYGNVKVACKGCNLRKGAKIVLESL